MKKLYLMAILFLVAVSVFPQATKTREESKKEKATESKEATRKTKQEAIQSRNQAATQQRNQAATQQRTRAATQSQTQNGEQAGTRAETQSRNQAATRSRNQSGNQSGNRVANPTRSQGTTQTGNRPASNRVQIPVDPRPVTVHNPGANRIHMEAKGSITLDNGNVIRHQNDEVFTRNPVRFEYQDNTVFRNSDDFRRDYHEYHTWYDYRRTRYYDHNSGYQPLSIEIRRDRNVYRQPLRYNLIWTPILFNRFMYYYPYEEEWNIEYGSQIETISAYDVMDYVGTVRRVYGRVEEVYFSREDNNYILYIGERFPYQDMSIVIPRSVARMISPFPEMYFNHQDIWMIGLIDMWDEKPEMVIRDEEQIRRY